MPHVLVIEDDVQLRRYLKELLEGEAYVIYEASNGIQGLSMYETNHPDIVLTDIVMPDMEGLEFITMLKKQNPETPIIAMSGGNQGYGENHLQTAVKLGAEYALSKPFTSKELLENIRELLKS